MLKVLSILFVAMIVLSGCGEIAGNKLPAEAETTLLEYVKHISVPKNAASYRITSARKATNLGSWRNPPDELWCVTIEPAVIQYSNYYYDFQVERYGLLWEASGTMPSTGREVWLRLGCDNWREQGWMRK